jgi:hypothetical protein
MHQFESEHARKKRLKLECDSKNHLSNTNNNVVMYLQRLYLSMIFREDIMVETHDVMSTLQSNGIALVRSAFVTTPAFHTGIEQLKTNNDIWEVIFQECEYKDGEFVKTLPGDGKRLQLETQCHREQLLAFMLQNTNMMHILQTIGVEDAKLEPNILYSLPECTQQSWHCDNIDENKYQGISNRFLYTL